MEKRFTNCFGKFSLAIAVFCLQFYGLLAQNTYLPDMGFAANHQLTQAGTTKYLKDVLSELQQQYGIQFSYRSDVENDLELKMPGQLSGKNIEEILSSILEPNGLKYKKVQDVYIIIKNKASNSSVNEVQQKVKVKPVQIGIRGIVRDENEIGMPGVSVRIKDTQIGTTTDIEGIYRLSLSEELANATLIFSFVGYLTEEVPVNNQSEINIQLVPEIKSLQEVVVVGYGTQRKKDLTGAISSVKADDLTSMPVPSISDAIQGRAPGVQVISSGVPGADAAFRVRGTGTINNSNPLLVIDGVPTMSGLNNLNPNDIESIQVLKDASAAAIYGSRGANGVVIVTTKRGKEGKGRLEVDIYRGVQQATGTLDMLDAAQFAALHNDMMANNNRTQNPAYADPESLGSGTDWMKELFRTAPIQSYSLSYSGGTKNSNYYVSGNVFDQEGVVINTGFRRYTLQINTDSRVFERVKFGNNLTLNHDQKRQGDYSIRNTMAALPTQPVYNPDGSYAGPVGPPHWVGDIINPIGKAKLVEQNTSGHNIIGSVYGEVEILDNFSFRSSAGIQANFWDTRTWAPAYDWQPTPEPDAFLGQSYNKSFTWLWDNTATFQKLINGHRITALLGTSAQANRTDYMNGSIKSFANETTQQLNNGTLLPTVGGGASEWSILSYFARANYAYRDKYMATVTVRRDGSSRFGPGNKWGWFPSGSVAWRISEEGFFDGVGFINDLKLRAGYGITGNQEIGNYPFASQLQTIQYNFNGNIVPAVTPRVMPNPFVQWESVEQLNLGLDASLLNNRLMLTLDGYIKNTNDMLVPMAVPVSTGFSDIFVPEINAGKIQNKGIELGITSQNIRSGSVFSWTTDFNISYNKNRVVSLNDTIPLPAGSVGLNYNLARIQAGQPINAFYGFVTNGIFQTQEEVERYAVQVPGPDPFNRTAAGDFRFLDFNNDGLITDDDRTFIGNPNPDFIFALNNQFSFKGFDLSIFLQGIYGNQIFNANRIWTEGMAVAQNQTTATLNRWTGPGTSEDMPRAVFNDPNKNSRASNRFVEDGSYLRIKNITLGYSLPVQLIEKANLTRARIYASAQNLFTLTNYTGIDPEVPFNGIDLNVYPVPRTISLGVNLHF